MGRYRRATPQKQEEETQMSYVKDPEKDRIRIQVFLAVWAQNWVHEVKIFSKRSNSVFESNYFLLKYLYTTLIY